MSKSSVEASNHGGGGVGGDEFYEDIEAPKFVDFTAPDRYSSDTDRYWFCLRVGCDRKHEEEMDSEAIYKNFVLRVMAARSPNIRLRKALSRKPINTTAKCPMSAPAKPSRSRLPRMAILSSVSGKTINCCKERVKSIRPVAPTPKTKVKQPSNVAKALTTPRNNKRVSNPELFRSVRNPKARTNAAQNKRLVAKVLAFPSPKKATKTKISSELDTTVRKICAGMKKLDIDGQKRNRLGYDVPAPLAGSNKKVGAREVKSRVFDSLRTQKCKGADKASRCLKKKDRTEDLKNCSNLAPIEGTSSGDSSDMDVNDKSKHGSLEACPVQETSQSTAPNVNEEVLTNVSMPEKRSGENLIEGSSSIVGVEKADEGLGLGADVVPTVQVVLDEEGTESTSQVEHASSLEEEKIQENTGKTSDQNYVPTDVEEIGDHITDNDDKENSTAPDHNIEQNAKCKRKILGKLDSHEKYEKVTLMKIKKSSIADKRSAHGGKYVKPRPTNPKPFRLRTDERGILKEANHEKKLSTPLKENATAPGFPSKNNQSMRKKTKAPESSTFHKEVGQKMAASTPDTYIISKQQKNLAPTVLRPRESVKKTRILSVKRFERPGSVPSRRKEATCQLSVIKERSSLHCDSKEASKIRDCGASSATKPSTSGTSRALSRGRRLLTIPKEPNFHDIHVPKSCTKKLT